jgi:hypothetical protein
VMQTMMGTARARATARCSLLIPKRGMKMDVSRLVTETRRAYLNVPMRPAFPPTEWKVYRGRQRVYTGSG